MTKVNSKRLTPDSKVANVKDCQVPGQRQDDSLFVVATQRILLTVLVRDANSLWRWLLATSNPEFGIYVVKGLSQDCFG